MLVDWRHCECAEDQQNDKNVVDGEGLFDDIPREPFETGLAAHEGEDAGVEHEGDADPDARPEERLFAFDHMGMAMKKAEVEREEAKDEEEKADPGGEIHQHERGSLTSRGQATKNPGRIQTDEPGSDHARLVLASGAGACYTRVMTTLDSPRVRRGLLPLIPKYYSRK